MKRATLRAALTAMIALAAAGCAASNPSTGDQSKAGSGGDAAAAGTVITTKTADLGVILAGEKNMTVYLFEADKSTDSTCTGDCAAGWPPVLTTGAPTAAGEAAADKLGTTPRADGTTQVTYNGHPLYYFTKDADEKDTYGQGLSAYGAEWYTVSPDGNTVE